MPPQRDRERRTLRAGQGLEDLLEDRIEQVDKSAQGERHLRLDTACGEHANACGACSGHRLAPHRRLANPRLTFDHHRSAVRPEVVQEPLQASALRLAPD